MAETIAGWCGNRLAVRRLREGRPAARISAKDAQRISSRQHAVKAAEVEIHVDGIRLTGGYSIGEFDIHAATWIDVVVIRS